MKRLIALLVYLQILLPSTQAGATVYYANKTGSNTAPYDTAAKGATSLNTLVTVIAALGDGGGHEIYIMNGTYSGGSDFLSLTDADCTNLTIQGESRDGVIIAPINSYNGIYSTVSGVSVYDLTVQPSGAKTAIYYDGAKGTKLQNLVLKSNPTGAHAAGIVYLNNAGIEGDRLYIGNNAAYSASRVTIRASGSTYGTLTRVIEDYPSVPAWAGLWGDGTGIINVQNSIIGGAVYAVLRQSTGTFNQTNTINFGPALLNTSYPVTQTAGTLNLYTSLIEANPYNTTYYTTGTVALDATTTALQGANPQFRAYGKIGYVVPCVDDAQNFTYAQSVETLLAARGYHGTYFMEQANWNTANNAALRSMVQRGTMEIGSHSYSHSDLAASGKIWDLSGAVTISRVGDTITSAGGVINGFKAMTLATIKTTLQAAPHSLTVTAVAGKYETNVAGAVDSSALGEVLADSAASTEVNLLIDSTAATGLLKAELSDPKTWFADTLVNGAGNITDPQTGAVYVCNSFGFPYNTRSGQAISGVTESGFTSARNYGYQTLGSICIYNLHALAGSSMLGSTLAETKAKLRSILANAAYYGQAVFFQGHSEAEISTTADIGWKALLDVIAEFGPYIQVKSAQELATTLRASPWTYNATTGMATRSYSDFFDYHLKGGPLADKGTAVSMPQDMDGLPVPTRGYPIGPYEFRRQYDGVVGD